MHIDRKESEIKRFTDLPLLASFKLMDRINAASRSSERKFGPTPVGETPLLHNSSSCGIYIYAPIVRGNYTTHPLRLSALGILITVWTFFT